MYFPDPQYPTVFTGYDTVESRSKITGIIYNDRYEKEIILKEGEKLKIIINISPFFPLNNSQIADTGWIHSNNIMLNVLDVQRNDEGKFFHSVECREPGKLGLGDEIFAHIDTLKRQQISRHHTGTHLLYAALKDEFKDKIDGYSSFVSCQKLCLKFFYPCNPSKKQFYSIEERVCSLVKMNYPVLTFMTSMEKAGEICSFKPAGNNKKVRICQIDNVSCEVCNGTHCTYTGEIGVLNITSLFTEGDGFFIVEGMSIR